MIKSYKELTISKYEEIENILKKDIEEIDKQVELISALSNLSMDEVYNLPISKYQQYVDGTAFLLEQPKPKTTMPNKITINGKKYGVLKAIERMTTGQYIDLQTYMKQDMGVSWILTTILIPEGSKYGDGTYNVEDVEKEIYNNLDIETALSIAFFLQRKLEHTINASLFFLDWMMKRTMKKMPKEQREQMKEARKKLKDFSRNGTGFFSLTQ
jgi:hypothetical protein